MYNRWSIKEDLKNWLLSMEEHSFYIFLYCVLGAKCLSHASCLLAPDREVILARLQIYGSDLKDELQHFKLFANLSDVDSVVSEGALSPVSPSCLSGCPLPVEKHFAFIRAPDWTSYPRNTEEFKVRYRM